MLSHEDEIALARAWRDHGDERARDRLIQTHLRLVIRLARQFASQFDVSANDLVSEGTLGMLRGLEKFDPELGYRFSTYITWWVRAEIRDYIDRNLSVVRPRSRQRRSADAQTGNGPPRLQRDISLDAPVRGIEDQEMSHLDLLVATDDQESALITANLDERRRELYLLALETLTERERIVISSRHGDDSKATLDELSQEIGVSRERIRQIEMKAIEKLTAAIKRLRAANLEAVFMNEARLVKAGLPITPCQEHDDRRRAGSPAPRSRRAPAYACG